MPDNTAQINIVKPDGTIMVGTREQLSRLQLIGNYQEEGVRDTRYRKGESQTAKDYSTIGDKAKTFASGIVSGATLGLADPLVDTDEEKLRAKYNPNSRLAGEIVGGVAPSLVPGGEFLPAGAISKLAGGAGKALGGGLKGAAAVGAIEGAGAGFQATVSNATLSNDPLTAQSALAGIGYGALFGAGLNTAIHGAGMGLTRAGEKLEVKTPEPTTVFKPKAKDLGEIDIVNSDNYDVFRRNIADTQPAKQFTDDYIAAIDSDAANLAKEHAAALQTVDDEIIAAKKYIEDVKSQAVNHNTELTTTNKELADAQSELEKYTKQRKKLAEAALDTTAKDKAAGGLLVPFQETDKAFTKIRDKVSTLLDANPQANELSKIVVESKTEFQKALKEGDYTAASNALDIFNRSTSAFRERAATIPGAPKLKHIKIPTIEKGIREPIVADLSEQFQSRIAAAQSKLDDLGTRDYPSMLSKAQANVEHLKSVKTNFPALDTTQHATAKQQYADVGKSLDMLRNFPDTVKEFQGMGTAKVNSLMDSLNHVMSSANTIPELQPIVASLEKATQSLIESTGIKAEGSITEQLKAIHKISKEANTQQILGPIEHEILKIDTTHPAHHSAISDGALAYGASKLAGVGYPGYLMGRAILGSVEGLAGVKTAVQQRISKAAKSMGKAFKSSAKNYVVPKLEPLYTKLNGERDKEAKTPAQAAKNRINELMEITPVVTDTLFKGMAPLALGEHSDLFAAIHAAATAGHSALIELLPKDRLGTTVGFNQTWEPNPIETVITAKILGAFYNPVDVMERALKGQLDPIEIKTVEAVFPDVYAMCQSEVMNQVATNPHLVKSFNNQQAISTLLGIKCSSALDPKNTIDAQKIFFDTPQVQNASDGGGMRNNSGGGRPSKQEPPTAAQSLLGG